ncbi:MAG TPA: ABC transporter ATP-binding protein [Phycisphaerales bacterium]|nr:ABC transporter ATP-binding protein [Phycisphaerales bacterium]
MTRRDFLHPSRLTGDPFWAFARSMLRYRGQLVLTLVMVVISAVALGAGIAGVKPVLDAILGERKDLPTLAVEFNTKLEAKVPVLSFLSIPQGWIDAMPAGDPFKGLVWIMVVLIALAVVGAGATFLHSYVSLTIVNATVTAVRRRAYRAVLRAPLREVVQRGPTDAISRIVNDSSKLTDGLNVLLSKTLLQGAKGLAALGAAVWFSWRVTLVAVVVAPALYTIIRKLGKRIRRASGAALESQADLFRVSTESLQGLRVVKAHDAEHYEAGRFHQINKKVLRELNRVRTARAIASPLTDTLSMAALAVMTLVAGRAILAGHVAATDFILAVVSLAVAGAAAKPLTALVHDIQTSTPAAERLRELICLPPEPGHTKGLPVLARHSRSIEFRDVTLTYPGRETPALRHLSVTVPSGQRVAFVGPNGCGKTTLLSLVNRMFDPDSGSVLVDGVDIRECSVRSLRRQVGVVTQETVLFQGTIRENIAYGSWASEEKVLAAAKRARAHEFIASLPKGYDTDVAQQGLSLSGGQRQRIAIARALLKDPAILILDEATSMIDAESEAAIAAAIADFSVGRTSLIVAHRLSTVVNCDTIHVMEAGRVIDSGTHEQLLERCALYRQLARHQLAGVA